MEGHVVTRFLVANWWSYHNTIFNFNKPLIYFVGHNGSGKTTILDAISLIIYAEDTNNLNYTSEDRRSAVSAIHWGSGDRALRPGKTYSYIIMEAKDANDRIYHQGIRYMSKGGSSKVDEAVYFWGEGTLESIHADEAAVTDNGDVIIDKSRRTNSRDAAFRKFFERRGYLETFRRATMGERDPLRRFRDHCRSILDNKKVKESTLSNYIKASIFPETVTADDYKELSETISKLDELKLMDQENRKKEQFLQSVYDSGRDYLAASDQFEFEQRIAPYINIAYYEEEKARQEALIEQAAAREEQCEKKEMDLQIEHDRLIEERTTIKNEEDPEKKAEAEVDRAKLKLKEASERHDKYTVYHKALERLLYTEGIEAEEGWPLKDVLEAVNEYLALKKNMSDKLSEKTFELRGQITTNNNTVESLQGSSAGGAANSAIAQMKADAELLKRQIKKEIPGADPKALYECVEEIRDESWQEAVEGLLGNTRFGVIVEPKYYDAACIIQHKLYGNKRDSIVLNTKLTRRAVQNSVPTLFVFNSADAQRYVEASYGSYILCETDNAYVQAEYALRKNGQHKAPGRSIKPGSIRKVIRVLGAAAIQRTIRELKAENKRLQEELTAVLAEKDSITAQMRQCEDCRKAVEDNREFASEEIRTAFMTASESLEKAEKELEEARSSDAVIAKKQKLNEIQILINVNNDERRDVSSEKRTVANERAAAEKELSTDVTELADFYKTAEDFAPPTEADFKKAEQSGLVLSLRGSANVNSRIKFLRIDKENKKTLLERILLSNDEIKDRFVNLPESISTRRDLERIADELNNISGLVFDRQLREHLSRLNASLEQSYVVCLQNVYQEYVKAQELRDSMNHIISKYQIGDYFYRLGPINSISGPDIDILELAKIQSGQGMQLDVRQIEDMNKVCQKAFAAGWNPFDYRRYITTDVQYRPSSSATWKNADQIFKDNSNGQQGILRYLFKIIVLYSQAFNGKKSLNFVATDEALQGVDETNSRYFFDILKELGIQCLISSFEDRFAEYSELTYICESKDGGQHIETHVFNKDEEADV